jgi:tetratricopeptide (TPR) repeat protein
MRLAALQQVAANLPAAIQAYSEAAGLNAHDRESRAALVALHIQTGDLKQALAFSLRASLRNPRFPRDLRPLLAKNKAFAQALAAEFANAELPPIHCLLAGEAVWAQGDTANARLQFNAAISQSASFFPAHLALGELLIEIGDFAAAQESLEAAQKLAPDLPEIRAALKRLAQ